MISAKPLSIDYKKKFLQYLKQAYPDRKSPEEFLDRTIFALDEKDLKDSLIIFDDDKIIGANMGIPTSAIIGDKEYNILWSYDTNVLPEYRNTDAGTFIVSYLFSKKEIFGAGLSSIAEKMQKIMKSKFIAYSSAFIKFNFFNKYLLNLIYPFFTIKPRSNHWFPETIDIKRQIFELVDDPEKLDITKNGYWNLNLIEFKRDKVFIKRRFFYKKSPYKIYQLKEFTTHTPVYFAVRLTEWKNIPLLYLVDYRFELNDDKSFNLIIEAAERLSKILNCAGVYTRSSLESLNSFLSKRRYIKKGKGAQIVTKFKPAVEKDYKVFFTPADSDMDFKM